MSNVVEGPLGGKAPHSLAPASSSTSSARFGGATITLRPYQERGAEAVRAAFGSMLPEEARDYREARIDAMLERIRKRPKSAARLNPLIADIRANLVHDRVRAACLVSPTGSGKGTVAAYTLTEAARKGNPSIFVVHTREIVKDVHQRLVRNGAPAGLILAGEPADPSLPIQVCSVQTLTARGERPPAKFIVWDEAHHCIAKTYRAVAEAYPHARHLGLTATPIRSDQTPLGDVFDVMIELATVRELTQQGFLVPAVILSPDAPTGHNLSAHPVSAYRDHTPGQKAIVFANNKHEAHEFSREFNEAGYASMAIDDQTPKLAREKIIDLFRSGAVRVLVNCAVLTEGFDAPETQVIIIAKSYGSPGGWIQATGRGLRASLDTGKTHCTIIDLCGNWHIHGRPSDDRGFSLFGEPIVMLKRDKSCCPKCEMNIDEFLIEPGGLGCPHCGFVRVAEEDNDISLHERLEIVEKELHVFVEEQMVLPFFEAARSSVRPEAAQ